LFCRVAATFRNVFKTLVLVETATSKALRLFYFMATEIWKDVIAYEGLYQVSNLGNVKRIGNFRGVNKAYLDNYYLKPIDNGKGYLRIKLTKNNQSKRIMLHRIIAEAFIENQYNKPFVNHINSDKKDNCIKNLEWCTQSENCLHSVKLGRWTQGKKRLNN
jgi:hypothetical protein